jgi:hypothetical protein
MKAYTAKNYTIYDAPGVDDREISPKDWIKMYRSTL